MGKRRRCGYSPRFIFHLCVLLLLLLLFLRVTSAGVASIRRVDRIPPKCDLIKHGGIGTKLVITVSTAKSIEKLKTGAAMGSSAARLRGHVRDVDVRTYGWNFFGIISMIEARRDRRCEKEIVRDVTHDVIKVKLKS